MGRQYSMAASFPPVTLLAAAADAAGRTSVYASLRNALKAWIIVEVNQGNAAPVLLSVLQAQDSTGTGSKAITNAVPIWLDADTSVSDALVAQANGATLTTSATLKDKLVLFEITPSFALDEANGFNHIAISTGASNAGNVTAARLHVWGSYQQATPPTTIV
jgi:hypothetical protein